MRFLLSLAALSLVFTTTTVSAALPFKGVDWSSLLVEEAAGKTYKNAAGQTQPLETILKANGVNTVRQRIWVNPSDGNYNLDYNLKLAKRAKAAGLGIYLDFHYSDTWADGGHQVKPAAWNSLSVQGLTDEIYTYTKSVMDSFASNGLPLSIVSIGNEIRDGMLWPEGQRSKGNTKTLSSLLHSASTAIKDSKLSSKPKVMIHIDNGWDYSTQQDWYDSVFQSNGGFGLANFDIQGISYYPFYGSEATLAAVSSSMSQMAKKYGKSVMVAETDWPSYCPNPKYAFPADTKSIPISVDGQTQWMKAVASRVSGIGSGLGQGLFYWEPAWIDNAALGSSCGYNLFVTDQGQAESSMASFQSI